MTRPQARSTGSPIRFKSKIGSHVGGVVAFLVVSLVMTVFTAGLHAYWIRVLLLVGLTVVIWLIAATDYTFNNDQLVVRSGPYRRRLSVMAIQRVRRIHSWRPATALALDRIELSGTQGAIVISPEDRRGFLAALKSRNPGVELIES